MIKIQWYTHIHIYIYTHIHYVHIYIDISIYIYTLYAYIHFLNQIHLHRAGNGRVTAPARRPQIGFCLKEYMNSFDFLYDLLTLP